MTHDTADLAAMIGSRICHDLISPIGAIGNGLELMALGGSTGLGPEFELINDSCASASARIRFFRVAFGSASDTQKMTRRDITGILDGIGRDSRVTTRWCPVEDLERSAVQIAFLAQLCLETALPHGGEVTVDRRQDRWHIMAVSPRLMLTNGLWALFDAPGTPVDLTPSRVEFALLDRLARAAGTPVRLDRTHDTLTLTI